VTAAETSPSTTQTRASTAGATALCCRSFREQGAVRWYRDGFIHQILFVAALEFPQC